MSAMTEPANGKLRINSLHRENATARLRDAAADGRLSFEELEERIPKVLAATVRSEVIAVLDDLVPVEEMDAVFADPAVAGQGPGYRFDTPLVLDAKEQGAISRAGNWVVPPFLEVITGWARVYLNFTAAVAASPVIDLVVLSGGGTVVLVVPEGWGVDTERVGTSGQNASARSRVRTRPEPGKPRIVVRGRTTATMVVRHPNVFDRRRQRRWLQSAARPAISAGTKEQTS